MDDLQLGFGFNNEEAVHRPQFPTTRYQGSKRGIIEWIWANVQALRFHCVLDVFGGTGAFSYRCKQAGKQVIYNDYLRFNWNIGVALIENSREVLQDNEIELLQQVLPNVGYPGLIESTFSGIYFTEDENIWLDTVAFNIDHVLKNDYKRALARFALFQACIAKRPYNLFHRANLYMRMADVKRGFGNKATWDTPFAVHFRNFAHEANRAVFDNGQPNVALQLDALATPTTADLVYLDPPYVNARGIGVDYREFYHFLEGLADYSNWSEKIDYQSKHRRLIPEKSSWSSPKTIGASLDRLIARHQDSIIVMSYRDDGVPTKDELLCLLAKYKTEIREFALPQKYVLSHQKNHELLLIAE